MDTPVAISAAAHAAALWTGLNLLLLLVLSFLVVRQRRKHKVKLGDGGAAELLRAQRVFGNATEYVPVALVGLAVLAIVGAPAWMIHALGAMLFVGRIAHAIGLSRSEEVSPGRMIGALLTWVVLLITGVVLVIFSAP